ncbi:tRNA (adenosine(37)-N6)-dimethylallyltransferase MiaA [Desulfofustis glycolicus]|uniref:tRNA dimethylallyltransferase n=1 Tax=Desulfofustis glycolicus DSM 9705 TaxID=1121409 RepID=A0A1M5U9T5_9BACT|nr:tRNA (adenosine(37)-N6)-dimethylallyltransferase MiaA [Desulfofustis glycolicus]SHH59690.1 tRNA dimethylallyltransferase [Desulfofustis glycolicus DSM 9705]
MLIENPVLVLIGPTAVGKTDLSLAIARKFGCEIVSVDSMQVYRYMDIGTAKIEPELRREIPHHLIDIVDPDQPYHAARFVEDALAAIRRIHQRNALPLLTGGTGLYLRALLHGLFTGGESDPAVRRELTERLHEEGSDMLYRELSACDRQTAGRLHPHDTARIIRALEVYQITGTPLSSHLEQQSAAGKIAFARVLSIGLDCPRPVLYERINRRARKMIDSGLEQEVRGLLQRGYCPELKSMQAIGYRHMLTYLSGNWSREQLLEQLARDTRRYAKRQMTWFRKDQTITWLPVSDTGRLLNHIGGWLKGTVSPHM